MYTHGKWEVMSVTLTGSRLSVEFLGFFKGGGQFKKKLDNYFWIHKKGYCDRPRAQITYNCFPKIPSKGGRGGGHRPNCVKIQKASPNSPSSKYATVAC